MHQHFYHHLPPNKVVKMVVWPALSFLKTQEKPKKKKRERERERERERLRQVQNDKKKDIRGRKPIVWLLNQADDLPLIITLIIWKP